MKIKSIIIVSLFTIFSSLVTSCEIDNYEPPKDGFKGALIDSTLNIPFQAGSQSRIRMSEVKYGPAALLTYTPTKPDGTFENSPMFGGKYKMVPIEGAFFPADTVVVNIKGMTEVNFKVEPFLRIKASAIVLANSVTVTYNLSRSRASGKISMCKTLLSASSLVSNSVSEKDVTNDVSAQSDATILTRTFTDTITGLQSGTYYVRAAALANNSLSSYNYSEVIKIEIP